MNDKRGEFLKPGRCKKKKKIREASGIMNDFTEFLLFHGIFHKASTPLNITKFPVVGCRLFPYDVKMPEIMQHRMVYEEIRSQCKIRTRCVVIGILGISLVWYRVYMVNREEIVTPSATT